MFSRCLSFIYKSTKYKRFLFSNRTITTCKNNLASAESGFKYTSVGIQPQNYDYFLVLDFEATCDGDADMNPMEIIEFPVLKVCGKSFEVVSTFHQYVQPEVNPELTTFCTNLTGIIQDMVDGQPNIQDTLTSFHKWMDEEGLLDPSKKSVFVTCGDTDLRNMLPDQCLYFGITYPSYLTEWINIKLPYVGLTKEWPRTMLSMLSGLDIKQVGRHHSGIDDCKNTANILKALAEAGMVFRSPKTLNKHRFAMLNM